MAIESQTQIGMERDRLQAIAIARQLHAAEGVVEFLRGAAFAANLHDNEGAVGSL
jgi:hypothetical protein